MARAAGEERSHAEVLAQARAAAASLVGEAAVPGTLMQYEMLPLISAGKIDRAALARRVPATNTPLEAQASGPQAPVLDAVATAWDALLRCGSPADQATLFELGGNLLQLIQVHRRLEVAHDLRFSIIELFDQPRIADLVQGLQRLHDE